jgi:hypothetical protein
LTKWNKTSVLPFETRDSADVLEMTLNATNTLFR